MLREGYHLVNLSREMRFCSLFICVNVSFIDNSTNNFHNASYVFVMRAFMTGHRNFLFNKNNCCKTMRIYNNHTKLLKSCIHAYIQI